ncbi:MAG: hypothetical protein J2P31_04565 [Blastocatellia bacterium]|nr:hypothetical protein [Blastocatellia bacterium]
MYRRTPPFLLHWTSDEWQHSTDIRSLVTGVGIEYADILLPQQNARIRFTFLWVEENRWEGKDYKVEIKARVDTRLRGEAYASNVA